MHEKTRGAWIIHHTHKLGQVQDSTAYERLENAGRAGILLAAMAESKTAEIPLVRAQALAVANHITGREVPFLLDILKQHRLIDVDGQQVEVLGVTNDSVLEHTSGIYQALSPEDHEEASPCVPT
jgi:hypothetical protein